MAKVGLREWLAVGRAIAEGNLIRHTSKSHFVDQFESRLASQLGVKRVLTVNTGTNALICSLAAAGVGPGDEVLVPAYTWLATPAAAVIVGAVPILVDINETLTMDPIDLERKITPFTKAIIPVHMANLPCAMDEILAIARRHNLLVIEDTCQAAGVRYKDKFCGAIGDMGTLSFNKFKNINIGEGGAVLTNEERLFARAVNFHDLGFEYRSHGSRELTETPFVGMNMKANEMQGAMLGVQLSKLKPMMTRLRRRFEMFESMLAQSGKFHIAPHNDPANAVGLCITFPSDREAIAFARFAGVFRLLDNSKHVYTNWTSILKKQAFHPRMNPWEWAQRPINYDFDMCAQSLDILGRTCRIDLGADYPLLIMYYHAKRMSQRAHRLVRH